MTRESFGNFEKKRIEYNFEEGLKESIRRIEEIFQNQDYVVVGISGSKFGDWDVGKTFLKGKIAQALREKKIPVITPDDIDFISSNLSSLKHEQDNYGMKDRGVIIIGALGFGMAEERTSGNFRESEDSHLNLVCKEAGLPIVKIDLRISLYRPDQGNLEDVDNKVADIIIRNEKAKIKSRNF